MRWGRLVVALGVLGAIATGAAVLAVLALGDDKELLPDLEQAAPGELATRRGGTPARPRFFLGFESAAANVGDGPVTIVGTRHPDRRDMQVVQQIRREDGSRRTLPVTARLRYVRSADHSHWHMLGFMRYELRRAGRLVLPDRKTGFCLGDRYEYAFELSRAEPRPTYTDECGKGRRDLLQLVEGISVGYGDDYAANLEGQEFDVTGLPAGSYLLVHRVNRERVLRESNYGNNVSSMALILSWPQGRSSPPRFEVTARCPGTPTCP